MSKKIPPNFIAVNHTRLGVCISLFLCVLFLDKVGWLDLPVFSLSLLITLEIFLGYLYLALVQVGVSKRILAGVQTVMESIMISCFVYLTSSSGLVFFSLLYFVPVVIIAYHFSYRLGIASAVSSSIGYGVVLRVLQARDLVHFSPSQIMGEVFAHVVLLLMLAHLIGKLASRERVDKMYLKKSTQDLSGALAQLKEQEEELLHASKLISVGVLSAGVAHEIHNPLTYLSSNLEVTQQYIQKVRQAADGCLAHMGSLSGQEKEKVEATHQSMCAVLAQAQESLKDCLDGCERIQKIVNLLRNFMHKKNEEYSEVNLNVCFAGVVSMVSGQLHAKIAVVKHYEENLPLVKGNPQQLSQVLMNLVVNAVDAIGDAQGTITLETRSDENNVYAVVKDTGCGISDEHQAKLFTPFFTTKEVGKGIGLGLSLSHKIIQEHSGKIKVQSKPDEGTQFEITLPRNP